MSESIASVFGLLDEADALMSRPLRAPHVNDFTEIYSFHEWLNLSLFLPILANTDWRIYANSLDPLPGTTEERIIMHFEYLEEDYGHRDVNVSVNGNIDVDVDVDVDVDSVSSTVQGQDVVCAVCLEAFSLNTAGLDPQPVVQLTQCKHMFHRACVAEWIRKTHKCPNCRCDYSASAKK